ncbi:MAG: RNase adapter RapZ [Gammaproteobacteria bacterium]|nr:RNase adapter RapZ [Gammaproteobacteria bacterium]
MKLVIISGLSGSGKTVALHTLEDENFYCVDNLPLGLLPGFAEQVMNHKMNVYDEIAVGIDARSGVENLRRFNEIIRLTKETGIQLEIVFLHASVNELIKRFSDTRRRHPLAKKGMPLAEAIDIERDLLLPVITAADLTIDTSRTNVHQLRALIKERLIHNAEGKLSVLFQSFGFKHSVPTDSDFVFDARCLPNPHWEPLLRPLTGRDDAVINFLKDQQDVIDMFTHICDFMQFWIPKFSAQNRYYLTVSIGCTGGQHRSVYLAEQLYKHFNSRFENVSLRHREME